MVTNAKATPAQNRITDEVLHLSFVSVYTQLNLTLRRIGGDDLDRKALENTISTVEQLHNDVNTRLDEDISDYNQLVDTLEQTRSQLLDLQLFRANVEKGTQESKAELDDLQHQAKMKVLEVENTLIQLKGQIETTGQELKTSQLAYATLSTSFDNYRRANPESLHAEREDNLKTISKMRAERKETNKRLQALQSRLNTADREVTASRSQSAVDRQNLDRMTALYEHLKKRVDFHDGREDVKFYTVLTEAEQELSVYIYNFHFGLLARNNRVRGHIIELADFHFQIRTGMLVAMDVVPGVWGNPVYERLAVFANSSWDKGIDEELHQRIMARLAMDFPKIHQRILDAKAAAIDELVLPAKVRTLLVNAGFNTVQSIAAVLPSALVEIKGVGEQTATDIANAINSWAIRWSRENGDIETYKSNVITASKKINKKKIIKP